MKILQLTVCFLLAAIVWAGCATQKSTPDPLAGWIELFGNNGEPNQAVKDDYQSYIQSLPPKEREYPTDAHFYTDGAGQYAIRFNVNLNGTSWAHVLIYNKENKRVKIIKYFYAYYRS